MRAPISRKKPDATTDRWSPLLAAAAVDVVGRAALAAAPSSSDLFSVASCLRLLLVIWLIVLFVCTVYDEVSDGCKDHFCSACY
jgi:hypothetical protein